MYQEIKTNWMDARKRVAAGEHTYSIKSTLLNTLIADIEKKAKDDGQRQVNDQDCIASIKKFLKNTEETIKILEADNKEALLQRRELNILKDFLPSQMNEEDIKAAVTSAIADGASNMGAIMKSLKEKYSGLYDGKIASEVAKKLLQ